MTPEEPSELWTGLLVAMRRRSQLLVVLRVDPGVGCGGSSGSSVSASTWAQGTEGMAPLREEARPAGWLDVLCPTLEDQHLCELWSWEGQCGTRGLVDEEDLRLPVCP